MLSYFKKFIPQSLFLRLQPIYHFFLSFLAALYYGFPSRHLLVIGVTGTKGKTTVVDLAHKILETSGFRVASMSSLRFKIGDSEAFNDKKMTMPGRFFVQNFLHKARRAGCKYVVIEVTSEGIKQYRHRFIDFDVAALTNVSPEHIESHGSFEKYVRAKLDLFYRLKKDGCAIINSDDATQNRFCASTSAIKLFYGKNGIVGSMPRYDVSNDESNEEGVRFQLHNIPFSSSLIGRFNYYNILAAISIGLNQHISLGKIAEAVSQVSGIPGRMEFIQKEPFGVVVDYAHTPDSLRKAYETLRRENTKLICVLGSAGGGRDKWKRPEFGRIASEFCSEIILTNEDPYDEDPNQILAEITFGISKSRFKISKILDRRRAIRKAIKFAKTGDTVIITGKGSEPWIMESKGRKIPWNEKEVVREELKRLLN